MNPSRFSSIADSPSRDSGFMLGLVVWSSLVFGAYAQDSPIHTITVGDPIPVADNTGDTWVAAWMSSGELYSPSNDTQGFKAGLGSNVMFNRILGEDAGKLTGVTVNTMSDYRGFCEKGPDGCTWKSSGCIAMDGSLYLLVARHKYGEETGDATMRQTAQNASFIRSADGGKTWRRSAAENQECPMFPGSRFATPYFIAYGQDGHQTVADQSDHYVYALSNNGFWDNGDSVILGRVLRANLPHLNGADWQFLKSGDGANDESWSARMEDAKHVIDSPNHLGMTGAVYLPVQKCYFMIAWHYPKGGGKMPGAKTETCWEFYSAPHPWGPWKIIGSHSFSPQGYYCPGVCQKFSSADGSKLWVFTAGDWTNPAPYRLTAVPLSLQ